MVSVGHFRTSLLTIRKFRVLQERETRAKLKKEKEEREAKEKTEREEVRRSATVFPFRI